jgi:hypothetical protein
MNNNNETKTIDVASLVYAIALNSGIAENAKELTLAAINTLRDKGFKTVQAGLKGSQKELPPLNEGELSHTICTEMASLAFKNNKLVYNSSKQLSEAVTKFKTSLAFALETGLWENNVSRYKSDMLKLQGVLGKVAIDAAIAAGTLKEVKTKAKTGAKTDVKPFDAVKIADTLGSKYNAKQLNDLIIELQKMVAFRTLKKG